MEPLLALPRRGPTHMKEQPWDGGAATAAGHASLPRRLQVDCRAMESDRPRYQGGRRGDPNAFRLHEPDMGDEEYEAYRAAWYEEFPCRCKGACRCQGPPARRPRRARLLVELPEEPPELTPVRRVPCCASC